MNICPKCKRRYTNGGKFHKSSHHIIPKWVYVKRDIPHNIRKMLDDFTLDICRECHSDLHELLEKMVRDLMYEEYQHLFVKALRTFLGGDHEIPVLPREVSGGGGGVRGPRPSGPGWNRPPSNRKEA